MACLSPVVKYTKKEKKRKKDDNNNGNNNNGWGSLTYQMWKV